MTRCRLYRLAAISGAVLGIAVLGAGVNALGLHTTLRVVSFCALAGAALSAGWHGVRYLALRHEEHLQDARRHRAPRPDRVSGRPAAGDAWPDPYAPDTDPIEQDPRRYYLNDEIHVHRTSSPA